MTTRRTASGVGARLRSDLARANMTQRELARRLAGPGENVEDWRRYVTRWAGPDSNGMSADNAEAVAKILGTDPERYKTDRFSQRAKLERELEKSLERTKEIRAELARLPKPQ